MRSRVTAERDRPAPTPGSPRPPRRAVDRDDPPAMAHAVPVDMVDTGLSARAVEGQATSGCRTRASLKNHATDGTWVDHFDAITRPTPRYQRVRPGAGKFLEAARA
jgi:hypothetical protein